MIDLEKHLVPQIAIRCKNLRETYGFTMDKMSDKSAVNRIEKGQIPKSGNFITATTLWDYTNTFDKTSEEIIFGTPDELEQLLAEVFDGLLDLILQQNLSENSHLYKKVDEFDIQNQKVVLSLAETFAEFNLQRYNFLKTDDSFMDSFTKSLDDTVIIGGKFVNLARELHTSPINEKTVIDLLDITDKLWLMCRENFIRSFKAEVIDELFEDFKFNTINLKVNQWILKHFNKIIVPDVLAKLKSNGIFKIGFMVKSMIEHFINEDLSESFQVTVPVQTKRAKHFQLIISNANSFDLPDEMKKVRNQLIEEANQLMMSGDLEKMTSETFEKFTPYGIFFKEKAEVNKVREVDIDAILTQSANSRHLNKIIAELQLTFGQSPIIHTSDFNSEEEIEEFFDDWYDSAYFKNLNIPGGLTNNSQLVQRLQERFNEETLESIERFIAIQNNLLSLMTEEELIKFAK